MKDTPLLTNDEAAAILFKVASLLELLQSNPFRVRAYRRTALQVLYLPRPLYEYFGVDQPAPMRGVGERMRHHLFELVNKGSLGIYESLLEEVGEPMASLLTIKGVGPRTAIRLVRELRVESLEDVVHAAEANKIVSLHGFGTKRQASLAAQARARMQNAA